MKLATDENFDGDIVRGLLRRQPDLDIVRVQDVELAETHDAVILAWAATQGRVLLTHDRETIPNSPMTEFAPANPCQAFFSSAIGCQRGRPSKNSSWHSIASHQTSVKTK
jgi:Domain of unknown function (DUF5615)